MCATYKKANASKEQTVLPRASLAHHSHPAISGHCNNRKAQALTGGTQMFFTPRPLMFLTAFPLQAQATAAGLCRRPDSLGAMSCLGNAAFAGHLPAGVCFLLCQGKVIFVNIIFCWELFGPPRVFLFFFFIARNKRSVRIITLLYQQEGPSPPLRT